MTRNIKSRPAGKIIKKQPQRTCIACRQIKSKKELIRLVCIPGDGVGVDGNGKMPGRGAYLCPTMACWGTGIKGNRLGSVLKTTINEDNRERLVRFGEELLRE
ncbi:MAG: YlxR family protein [Dehalococcoidales bacterium]|nr:MAG: YlxR family protein [Dehalococcoidales bacterium]